MIDILLTDQPLDVAYCRNAVSHSGAGGTVMFIGTVRNRTRDKTVKRLEFEAYRPMAMKEMQRIADELTERWDILNVCMHHRIGQLEIGEVPVIIAVSSAHRKAAFEASEFAINKLKETVPIWKKEIFEDGEEWVSAHP